MKKKLLKTQAYVLLGVATLGTLLLATLLVIGEGITNTTIFVLIGTVVVLEWARRARNEVKSI